MEFLADESGDVAGKVFGVDADALFDEADGHFVQVGGLGPVSYTHLTLPTLDSV